MPKICGNAKLRSIYLNFLKQFFINEKNINVYLSSIALTKELMRVSLDEKKNAKNAANEYSIDKFIFELYKLVRNFVPDFFFK